jgi:hypothetical protein
MVPPQKLPTKVELRAIPPKNDGREKALTREYLLLLYLRCTRKKNRLNFDSEYNTSDANPNFLKIPQYTLPSAFSFGTFKK